jgi:hypothetical protein
MLRMDGGGPRHQAATMSGLVGSASINSLPLKRRCSVMEVPAIEHARSKPTRRVAGVDATD